MLMPDMVRKANCLLASFPRVDPLVLTRLFQSYCLPLFGSALWSLSCPALYCIEVSFNMILQKVWYFSPSSRVSTIYFFVDPLLLRLQLLSVPLNYFSQSFIQCITGVTLLFPLLHLCIGVCYIFIIIIITSSCAC